MASEYGWTDDVIGDLTIKRLRQCVAAISERQWYDQERQFKLAAWQTRYICTFIASTVPSSEAGAHPLWDAAQEIGREWEVQQEEQTQGPMGNPVDPVTGERTDIKLIDPKAGSYESFAAFTGMVGGKPKP